MLAIPIEPSGVVDPQQRYGKTVCGYIRICMHTEDLQLI